MKKKAYLLLENGKVFEGEAFGAERECVGELVFTTGMVGYLETLTDPSYYGQIVMQTFPLVGNYGVIPDDFESAKPHLKAYIVREWCQEPSNFRSEGALDAFLKANDIPGLCGIDTRALTRIVREHGVMNARITYSPNPKVDDELRSYRVTDAVRSVSTGETLTDGEGRRVVLIDFGAKSHIERELVSRGCEVITVPYSTTADEILALKPSGVMLSNGPGDPSENKDAIKAIKKLVRERVPMFGICLGHQLLALANGAKTEKLKYGHRGGNQPALELATGRVYITSQNHGYAVVSSSLPDYAHESFINVNDKTCEGVEYTNSPAFSVQFHPEACAGPRDTAWLFDKFVSMCEEVR